MYRNALLTQLLRKRSFYFIVARYLSTAEFKKAR